MVAVLVPWWPSDPHREAAWQWVRTRYEQTGWEVIEGTTTGPWCKALAVADALARTDADHLVIADADCWTDRLPEAVEALDTHEWAVPHRLVHRLTQTATADLLSGGATSSPPDSELLEHPPYYGTIGGGVVAIRRDTYLRIPLDPRFVGWGEDHAWGVALRSLAGTPWVPRDGHLMHLWHPPQREAPPVRGPRAKVTIPDPANRQLDHRYRDAKVSRRRMEALVNEAREATWQSASR